MNSKQLNKLITGYYGERDQISAVIAILEAYEYDKKVFEKKLSGFLYQSVLRELYDDIGVEAIATTIVYDLDLVLKEEKLEFWKKSSKKRILKAYDIEQIFTYHSKE